MIEIGKEREIIFFIINVETQDKTKLYKFTFSHFWK